MKNCTPNLDEFQTDTNSPHTRTPLQQKHHHHLQSTRTNSHPPFLTEKQIYSREIVRIIMQREKNKTIRHQIGKVERNTSLYAIPYNHNPRQLRFDSVPPKHQKYCSLSSAKIQQINKGMKSRTTTASVTTSKRYHPKNMRSQMIDEEMESIVKFSKISVSGLATYKFSSVKAETSLAINRTDYQEKLEKQLQSISKRRDCAINRLNKILSKESEKRLTEKIRRSNRTIADFQTNTDEYLKDIREQNDREMLLYGDKAKKLQSVKDYMSLQQITYDVATNILQQIERCKQQNPQQIKHKQVIKTEINQDLQFANRRMPVITNKLKVRYITFAD